MTVFLLKNKSDDSDFDRKDPFGKLIPTCEFISILDFIPINLEALEDHLQTHPNYNGIIVTSQRAIDSLKIVFQHVPLTRYILDLPVYTVGPTSAERLSLLGFKNVIGAESGNGQALAEYILNNNNNNNLSFLFLAGQVHRKHLPEKLIQAGNSVDTFIVYRTEPCSYLSILEQRVNPNDWVVFFSPSHAQDAADFVKAHPDVKVGAIGPTTRAFLESQNIKVDAMAESPTASALLQAIKTQ